MFPEMVSDRRSIPTFLKALGRKPFPVRMEVAGQEYDLVRIFKHDFFAATGLFRHAGGRLVVFKIGRQSDLLGLPTAWIGRFLAGREARIYETLSDVEGVPALVGRCGDTGFVHDFVPGHPLQRDRAPDEVVNELFFDRLETLLDRIHAKGLAYVDLEKCENIIVGEDGKPHLIDFQISWYLPGWWGNRFAPVVWLRNKLQHMDAYHLLKHRRRSASASGDQTEATLTPPLYIRLHRAVVRPMQRIRRAVLKKLDPDFASRPR